MTTSAPQTPAPQQYAFQAEIKQLLHLLSHSLYQHRDVALRELISNASDALDKMRHLALLDETLRDGQQLEIRLSLDADKRLLTIADNGIGMSRDELIKNLGTIAHSGSLEFLQARKAASQGGELSLIGQFGVGFYSAFMLAEKVAVCTRSYQGTECWEWVSDGTGSFTVAPADAMDRGTQVTLHLKKDAAEFAQAWKVRETVRRYSSFVQYPIKLGDETLNDQKAIWVEPPAQVTAEQYERFYQHLTHHAEEKALWHLHVSIDMPIQFHALLYCPPTNVELLGLGRVEHGVQLCAKRILVQSQCRDVLPEWLRFLYGLVDSEDLPLNVSREALQDHAAFRKIRTALVGQVLSKLSALAQDAPDLYRKFYDQFGRMLKEGAATDLGHSERLCKLLRFASSHAEPATDAKEGPPLTSLDDYLQRAPADQKQIYYLGGPTLAALRQNPNLEIFRRRKLEVLLLTDPIDEFLMANVRSYQGRDLVSIDSEKIQLPESAAAAAEEKLDDATGFARVLSLFREALQDQVADVRQSSRLTDSPCCLVNAEGALSTQMQKLLQLADREFEPRKQILEVNAQAALIRQLCRLSGNPQHDDFIRQCARQLLDNARLLEGLLPEPHAMAARVQALLEEVAQAKAGA